MRLHFPNAEHTDVPVDGGRLIIGSAVSGPDTLRLPHLEAQHVAIEVDRVRGIWLSVTDGRDVHVNGRPIRERAQLRAGDLLNLGTLQVLIRPDGAPSELPPPASESLVEPNGRALLRAVAGRYFGRVLPLKVRTTIGRAADCDIVLDEPALGDHQAVIEHQPEGLYLRSTPALAELRVNGFPVQEAVLRPGDQLSLAQHRFIIEAPGWQPVQRTPPAMPIPPRANSTQVQRRPVSPPGSGVRPAASSADGTPGSGRSGQLTNWILAIAALVTLLALGTVIFLSVNASG